MSKVRHGHTTRELGPAPQGAKSAPSAPTAAEFLRHAATSTAVQRALAGGQPPRPAELTAMQRALGNRAVGAMLGRSPMQAGLIVNAPGDRYEREADRIAEQVMRMPAPPREEPAEDQQQEAKAQPAVPRIGDGAFAAGGGFGQQLNASRGRGKPLPSALQTEFEAKFGADFSGVTIHTGAQADGLNRSIQAEAFTHGRDIYVGKGQYNPNGMEDKRLLAHELTHVVQQNGQESPKARGNYGGLVISRLDNQVTIQRRLDTKEYWDAADDELKEAFKKYNEAQAQKKKAVVLTQSGFGRRVAFAQRPTQAPIASAQVPKQQAPEPKKMALKAVQSEEDLGQTGELEALQLIEAIVIHLTMSKPDNPILVPLMSDIQREFNSEDIRKAAKVQYFKRVQDTLNKADPLAKGTPSFDSREQPNPFNFITLQGFDAINPLAAADADDKARIAEKNAADNPSNMKLQQAAKVARGRADKKKEARARVKEAADDRKIDEADLASMRVYTAGDFKYINPLLESNLESLKSGLEEVTKGPETTWKFEGTAKRLNEEGGMRALMMEAMQHKRQALVGLAKLPNANPTETYRGVALTQAELDRYKKDKKPPPRASFTSTSTNRTLAEYYATQRAMEQGPGKLPVLLISTVTEGKDLNPVSLYDKEGEFLVLPGAEFTVTDDPVQRKNGKVSPLKNPVRPEDGIVEIRLRQTPKLQPLPQLPPQPQPAAPGVKSVGPSETGPRLRRRRQPGESPEKSVKAPGRAMPYHDLPVDFLVARYFELVDLRTSGEQDEIIAELLKVSRELSQRKEWAGS